MEKYKLIRKESKIIAGVKVYRIQALVDFGNIKKGDIGGFVESTQNLSQYGNCWINDNAVVMNNAKIFNDAQISGASIISDCAVIMGHANVYDDAQVCGHAIVNGFSKIYGNAEIHGSARINDHVEIYGNAEVYGYSLICDYAKIFEYAQVSGNAKVMGLSKLFGHCGIYGCTNICTNAIIHGDVNLLGNGNFCFNADISCYDDYIIMGPLGSRNDYTTFYRSIDNCIMVACGCFTGTIDEFIEKVKVTHKDNNFYKDQYINVAKFVKTRLLHDKMMKKDTAQ